MYYDFAPMEGATDAVLRRVHHQVFGGADRYWMPFWSPTQDHVLTRRVLRDVLPEYNAGVPTVPQLLTKSPEDFLWAAGELAAMGYGEVNLNLGCPSGTVTAKGKGAGFLGDLPRLERFLDEIFARAPLLVSVKTRLGVEEPAEFAEILKLYCRYPLKELTVHCRVLRDQYRRPARPECFAAVLEACPFPASYNGDLKTAADCAAFAARYPAAERVMIGRGLLADPALARRCLGGPPADAGELLAYTTALFDGYTEAFGSARNAMLRMKEHWRHLIRLLEDDGGWWKRMRKETDPARFRRLTEEAISCLPIRPDAAADW